MQPQDQSPPPTPAAQPEPSGLIITFDTPQSAELSIRPVGGVTVAQVAAAAWQLDAWARELRAQSQAARQSNGIVRASAVSAGAIRNGR